MSRLMLCVVCVLFASPSARADDAEDRAAALVLKLGGEVVRDKSRPGQPIVRVVLSEKRVTAADLRGLAPLQNLTTLDLTLSTVTDTDLAELTRLKTLTEIHLSRTKITDAGLKEVAALKGLTKLSLAGTKVTDDGVKELQKALPKCEVTK